MKNTNAQRGSNGRFGGTDGPKAKPVQVWLQPLTLELLDTLCSQWGVGRGKVIDQLLTRGPVPPSAWTEVESKASPTDSGPKQKTEPAPVPTDSAPKPEPEPTNSGPKPTPASTPAPTPEPEPTNSGPKPQPEPTDSGWMKSVAEALLEFERNMQAEWLLIKAEADRLKVNVKDLSRLLAALKIPTTFPISVDAEQAVRRELEDEHRARLGNDNATSTYIAKVQKLVANGTGACELSEILGGVESVDPRPNVARRYLFSILPKVGLPRYRKLVSSIWGKLLTLVSNGDPAIIERIKFHEKNLLGSPERRCLFWGALLRSPHIDDGGAKEGKFLEWIQYSVHDNYRERQSARQASDVLSAFGFGAGESNSRRVLGLPLDIELTRAGIKNAWKQAAQKAHPDKGGTNEEMHAIEEAKNRLLMMVNS